MANDGSVAPKERVNITYKPAGGDGQAEVELPLKILAVGDYTGRPDSTSVGDRKAIEINKDNFNEVMKAQELSLSIAVADKLSGASDEQLAVQLKFEKLSDFGPDAIVQHVPELRKLMELRKALETLSGPLGSLRGFREKLKAVLGDEASRERLLAAMTKDRGSR